MNVYEITIMPISGFVTPLKGDTLFGHLCWQIANNTSLFGKSLPELLVDYKTTPFAVVSSAFPKFLEGNTSIYALKRPDMPMDMLFDIPNEEAVAKRKEYKGKRWMLVKTGGLKSIKGTEYLNDNELTSKLLPDVQESDKFFYEYTLSHNTISRATGTTGEAEFAPYAVEQIMFASTLKLAVFIGIDERLSIENVKNAFISIGKTGFGKDASTGQGRFDVCDVAEVDLTKLGSPSPNALYTLSPCVPEKNLYSEVFFVPFVRFGRHGDRLAISSNPFKNPVIMADEGAVFLTDEIKTYIGTAITGISKVQPEAVSQGYSLAIPVRVEVQ